jgi:hypothetical protein
MSRDPTIPRVADMLSGEHRDGQSGEWGVADRHEREESRGEQDNHQRRPALSSGVDDPPEREGDEGRVAEAVATHQDDRLPLRDVGPGIECCLREKAPEPDAVWVQERREAARDRQEQDLACRRAGPNAGSPIGEPADRDLDGRPDAQDREAGDEAGV